MNSNNQGNSPVDCSGLPLVPFLTLVHSHAWSCLLCQHSAPEESCSIIHSAKLIECPLCAGTVQSTRNTAVSKMQTQSLFPWCPEYEGVRH